MHSSQPKISSIPQLIAFFKNNQQHFFYIGRMYCTLPVDLHEFVPNFEIITCFDPFNQRFPFIKVPQFIRNVPQTHRCMDSQCQRMILRDQETVAYLRSKSLRPKIIYMLVGDPIAAQLCKINNFNLLATSHESLNIIGNKVKVVQHLKSAGIPFIKNVCGKFGNYEQFKQMISVLNTDNVVVQAQNGASGIGTYFIENKQAYDAQSKLLQNQKYQSKIAPFKKLKSFGISAVTGGFGTILGPIHSQHIGNPKMTVQRAGFCANEHRDDYFEDKQIEKRVRYQICTITKNFGEYFYKEGLFRGIFGIDFVVDMDNYEVFLMQINPRITGQMVTTFQLYQAEGIRFPHILYHFLQFMDVETSFDVDALNREWQDLRHYSIPASHLILKALNQRQRNLPIRLPAGVWRIQNGEAKFTGRFTYKYRELAQDEYFFMPHHGFSKANIFMNRRCQDFDRKLTPHADYVVDKFLELIAKNNHE